MMSMQDGIAREKPTCSSRYDARVDARDVGRGQRHKAPAELARPHRLAGFR